MKRYLCYLLALAMVATLFCGCQSTEPIEITEPEEETGYLLNGYSLSKFTIVYGAEEPDYSQRAAAYLQEKIAERTGVTLPVVSDQEQEKSLAHEIVVGETNRKISAQLDISGKDFQFAFLADDAHVAMEGEYFVIAAAAYYFVETYFPYGAEQTVVAKEETVCSPIAKKAKNFIYLIGDGMGLEHTELFGIYSTERPVLYSDKEDLFYGRLFPNFGFARTDSLSGTTDSAAAGTALATGFKTRNTYVGIDDQGNPVRSLTEIANELGKATAIMSTEGLTGATPAAFTAHTGSRYNTEDILASQNTLKEDHGTLILGNYGEQYSQSVVKDRLERDIQNTLQTLSKNENGFFIMYEEAYIDKHSHSAELTATFFACVRFNQAIGCFMEYAFYHPETVVIITADHETGGLTNELGEIYYTDDWHTSAKVPVFAYGYGTEVFDGVTIENIQIPKTIAKMWGVEMVGSLNETYPALNVEGY